MSSRKLTLNISLIIALILISYNNVNKVLIEQPLITTGAEEEWTAEENGQETVTLTIWTPSPILDFEIRTFESKHPNIKIEITNMQSEPRIIESYLNALSDGTAPDILALTYTMLGSINSSDLIADLSHSNLDLEEYRKTVGEYLWEIHQSLDGQRTISIPYQAFPNVLYYRYDILKEHGYPAEPEELTAFLQHPDNWLKLANDLQQKGIWIQEWPAQLLTIMKGGQFIFDRQFEIHRSSEFHKQLVNTAIQFQNLSANVTIWNSNGLELIQEGQMAMVMLPSYGEGTLADWVPEQAGKWRATHMPLGNAGIDLASSKSLSVTKQSKNKAAASKFLAYVMDNSTTFSWYDSAPLNSFLGGQDSGQLYLEMLHGYTSETIPTPLDVRAMDAWGSSMDHSLQNNFAVDDAVNASNQSVLDITSVAQEQLQRYIQGSPN